MKSIILLLLLTNVALPAEMPTEVELLAKASRLGDVKTLETVLSAGVQPDSTDRFGHTALYYAAAFNHVQAVQVLLEWHADPNSHPSKRMGEAYTPATPLQYAAQLGNRQVASTLIAAGARLDERGPTGRTALQYARGQLDMTQLLIEKGADVNARDAEGASALDEAASGGWLDEAAILLAHGARVNESDAKTGATPINEAAYAGHTKLVGYLLQFRPDLEIADKNGYRPLDNAIRMGREETAVMLLEAEANEVETPQFLAKAMEGAVRKDESAVVESVLRRGGSANGMLPSGVTPLDAAAFAGASKTVDVLLKHNGEVNARGQNGSFALEDASLKGFDKIAATLLDHGAAVNQQNSDTGTTALYAAAAFGKAAVVELLLKRGANANLCGANHKSVYEAAFENGYHDVAERLAQAGAKRHCEASAAFQK